MKLITILIFFVHWVSYFCLAIRSQAYFRVKMMLSSPEVSKLDSSSFAVQNILYLLISHFFSPLYLSNKVLIKRSIVFLILYSDVKSHIVHNKTSSCNFFSFVLLYSVSRCNLFSFLNCYDQE